MKKTALVVGLAILPLSLCADSLSLRERNIAMSHLHASRKMFLDVVAGLSEAQWKFKPAPDRWSLAECAEHIATSEGLLLELVTKKILQTPADPAKKALVQGKDDEVLKVIADRTRSFNAPESLRPSGRWDSKDALVEEFKRSRDRTIRYVEATQDPLRIHFLEHPGAGLIDAYQWILLGAAHTERHVKQIEQVKEHPGFPKR